MDRPFNCLTLCMRVGLHESRGHQTKGFFTKLYKKGFWVNMNYFLIDIFASFELLFPRSYAIFCLLVCCLTYSCSINDLQSLMSAQNQSYEIKSPPWNIWWFEILWIFPVKNQGGFHLYLFPFKFPFIYISM